MVGLGDVVGLGDGVGLGGGVGLGDGVGLCDGVGSGVSVGLGAVLGAVDGAGDGDGDGVGVGDDVDCEVTAVGTRTRSEPVPTGVAESSAVAPATAPRPRTATSVAAPTPIGPRARLSSHHAGRIHQPRTHATTCPHAGRFRNHVHESTARTCQAGRVSGAGGTGVMAGRLHHAGWPRGPAHIWDTCHRCMGLPTHLRATREPHGSRNDGAANSSRSTTSRAGSLATVRPPFLVTPRMATGRNAVRVTSATGEVSATADRDGEDGGRW